MTRICDTCFQPFEVELDSEIEMCIVCWTKKQVGVSDEN